MDIGRITIIGFGLLGSSLARVIRDVLPSCRITACSPSEATLTQAMALNLADEVTTHPENSVKDADMVIISTPLGVYESIATAIAPHLPEGAIVTDMGSAKQHAIDTFFPHLTPEQQILFVPGHPIAGSEKSGVQAGFREIFQGKKVILTPLPNTSPLALDQVTQLWNLAGSHVEEMDPTQHDTLYATVSHAIQLTISSYAIFMDNAKHDPSALLSHPLYQKFIRISGSNTAMWRDICLANRKAILCALKALHAHFSTLKRLLEENDLGTLERFMQQAQSTREHFPHVLDNAMETSPLSLLPRLIGCATFSNVSFYDMPHAAGGFLDVTNIVMAEPIPNAATLSEHRAALLVHVYNFLEAFDALTYAIEEGKITATETLLNQAHHWYERMTAFR
jgi:prephenate dehydrogenase